MDIQYVLEVYACAMFIVSYISKAQKRVNYYAKLLRKQKRERRTLNSKLAILVTNY